MAASLRQDVRDIVASLVASRDLSQLTAKSVRLEVRSKLGDRAGDEACLKILVRELINEVMFSVNDTAKGTPAQEEMAEGATSSSVLAKSAEVVIPAPTDRPKSEEQEKTIKDPLVKSVGSGAIVPSDPRRKRRRLSRSPTSDSSQDVTGRNLNIEKGAEDLKDVQEHEARGASHENVLDVKANNNLEVRKDNLVDLGHSESDDSSEVASRKAKPCAKSSSKRIPNGTKPTSQKQGDPQVQKLLRVARELGVPVPPSRLRCEADKKFGACLAHLRSKGLQHVDVMNMTRRDIVKFRRNLERERELDGLDTSNIIPSNSLSSQRPTRAAALRSCNKVAQSGNSSDNDENSNGIYNSSSSGSDFQASDSDKGEDLVRDKSSSKSSDG